MSKYKVGDRVQIKSVEFLEKNKKQSPSVIGLMYKSANETFKIQIDPTRHNNGFWHFYNGFWWHEDWLEPVKTLHVDKDLIMNLLEV